MTYSFIFQIHNRQDTIQELLFPFVEAQNNGFDCELIVCNDGSTDNTLKQIHSILNCAILHKEKNFIIEMFNAYETELTYKAIKLSEGDIITLIQDDDYYHNMEFAIEAKRLFEKHPDVAALSPKHGVMLNNQMNIIKIYGTFNSSDLPICTPMYDDNLQIVDIVDRAPMIIRRKHYEQIGGIDRNLLRGGYNDWDMCLRWKKEKLKVGIFNSLSYQFRKWYPGSTVEGAVTHIRMGENREKVFARHYRLQDIIDNYQNTKEYHAKLFLEFLDAYLKRDYLIAHKNYCDHNIYGEVPFHYLWELLVEEMPLHFKFLEIGVFKGQVISLIGLLMNRFQKGGTVVGVSTFDGSGDKYSNYSKTIDYETVTKETWNHFNPENINAKLNLIRGSSESAYHQISHYSPYDIAYIDGCHDYEVVKSDIKNYSYMVKKDGFIVMDDSATDRDTDNWPGHFEVGKATSELMDNNEDFKFLFAIGHIKLYRKT
jgi:glycosyltransferase involved in cell wall biosynthesis